MIVAIIVIAAIAAAFYYTYSQSSPPSGPLTVRVARTEEITSLDPAICYSVPSIESLCVPYERLIDYNDSCNGFKQALAESWQKSSDAMTYTLNLRREVKFHDGTPFNASCVKFNIERALALNSGPSWMYLCVDNIEVLDTYTVKFVLKYPYAPFLDVLASYWNPFMMSPSYVGAHSTSSDPWAADWMSEHTCGTGAYMLEQWVKGQYISFVRFQDYWRGWEGKHVDKVYMPLIKEWSTIRMNLEAGDLDFIFPMDVKSDDIPALERNPSLKIEKHVLPIPMFLTVNHLYGPCSDVRVRQAICYALNYTAVEEALNGMGTQAQGPLPKSVPGHDDTLFVYSYDPAKAKALLEQAGYPDGLQIEYAYNPDEAKQKVGAILQQSAEAAGISVKLSSYTHTTLTDLLTGPVENRPELVAGIWPPDFVDPDALLTPLYKSTEYCAYGYNNSEVDRLLNEAAAQPVWSERVRLYNEVQQLIIDDIPYVWVIDMAYPSVIRTSVKGYSFNLLYSVYACDFYSIYVER
jgi:peptide/nickel transport system substrate-binding protein